MLPSHGLPTYRRQALRTLLRGLELAALAGFCRVTQAAPAVLSAASGPARAERVAEGVYLLAGAVAVPDRGNAGRVGNLGFVVGSTGVAVIDTGSSRARAEELQQAIRSVTDHPIRVVVITHPAQEFLFGASAFLDQGIPVLAHPATPRLMQQRCQHCLETLVHDLGAERMTGTRLPTPAELDLPRAAIDLGDRRLDVLAGPAGTVPGNLMVRDPGSRVLFTGALLSIGRIPGVQDTRPLDWQNALSVLDDPALQAVVPAYGPVARRVPAPDGVSIAGAQRALAAYLQDLELQARDLYAAATPLAELERLARLPRYQDWNGYPGTHQHNIFYRYLQLEAEDLASQ